MEGNFTPESLQAMSELPSGHGYGRKLFHAIDEQVATEDISPYLAKALRRLFVSVEKNKPGALEQLALKGAGGIRYATTQLEDGLLEIANLMDAEGKFNGAYTSGPLMGEYLKWVRDDGSEDKS